MIQEQQKGLKRNVIDKYYTKKETVDICIDRFNNHVNVSNADLIIEPSSGNGAFIPAIKNITENCVFYDIQPENGEIIQQDYLCYDYCSAVEKYDKIHVLGNPPFGRQSSLAIQFIKKSCEFCHTLSFILPKSFKKDSLKKAFPLEFHLVYETDLPENSFLVDGVEHDVPCIFQIWEKKPVKRELAEILEPKVFVFVKKDETPDVSIRRVGVNAGVMSANIHEKSIQSHYFIRFTNGKTTAENMNTLSVMLFEFNNTVGPKSISKQELIGKMNVLL